MKAKELKEDKIIKMWLDACTGSNETRNSYVQSMQWYTEHVKKSPEDILLEAEAEIRTGKLMRERNITPDVYSFHDFMVKRGLASKTIQTRIASLRSFFNYYNIQFPTLPRKITSAQTDPKREVIPTKDDIIKLLKYCDPLERAIVLVGVSSGLTAIDIANLKISDFKNGLDLETGITSLNLIRIKTNYKFCTFLSPEATEAVNDYLAWRDRFGRDSNQSSINQHIKSKVCKPSGYLFVSRMVPDEYLKTRNELLRKLDKKAIIAIYDKLSEQSNMLAPIGEYNLCRSHNMRRFFYSAMRNAGMDFKDAEYLMGHKMGDVEKAYHRPDIEKFKAAYTKFVHAVTIDKASDPTEHISFKTVVAENEVLRTSIEEIRTIKEELHKLKQIESNNKELEEHFIILFGAEIWHTVNINSPEYQREKLIHNQRMNVDKGYTEQYNKYYSVEFPRNYLVKEHKQNFIDMENNKKRIRKAIEEKTDTLINTFDRYL